MKSFKTYIIVEAGINHNGNYKMAITSGYCKKSGADAIISNFYS